MRIKSLWMSDLHLGTKASNADLIIDVLKYFDTDLIILNGDVIDFWQLGFTKHWSKKHNNILRLLFKKAKESGADDPEAVAAAAMWKNIKRK